MTNFIFDELWNLGQTCVIPYYTEIINSLYLDKFLYKMIGTKWERLYLKIKINIKYLEQGVKWRPIFDTTFLNSLKQFQSNISQSNNNRKFWTWNNVYFLRWKIWSSFIFSKFKNLTILVISLSQNWTKKEANLYTKFQLW